MRLPQVAIDFGTPPELPSRTSSDDFECVPCITSLGSLRRVTTTCMTTKQDQDGGVVRGASESSGHEEYDDDGKNVYAKLWPTKGRVYVMAV